MIQRIKPQALRFITNSNRQVEGVWISDSENEAFAKASEVRRLLPRGDDWIVRTSSRSVACQGIKVLLWTVTAAKQFDTKKKSACAPDDPSGDLQ